MRLLCRAMFLILVLHIWVTVTEGSWSKWWGRVEREIAHNQEPVYSQRSYSKLVQDLTKSQTRLKAWRKKWANGGF